MSNNNNKRRYVPPTQSDTVFRIISSAAKSDSLLSLSGDGVKILIEDYAGDPTSDDRIVVIISAATEQLPDESAAQLALIRVFERIVENDIEENSNKSLNSSSVGCRLLAPSYQVGCVLGRGGKIVEKIRQESGAQIRVLPKDQSPIPPPGDEFIQVLLTNLYSVLFKLIH
jgi:poly(rC)-binding protein 2/3/4